MLTCVSTVFHRPLAAMIDTRFARALRGALRCGGPAHGAHAIHDEACHDGSDSRRGPAAGWASKCRPPGYIGVGDTVRIEIEGIGVLENPVVAEPSDSAFIE